MTFAINSIQSQYINNAQWAKFQLGDHLNGIPTYAQYLSMTMFGAALPMSEWTQWKQLEGTEMFVTTTNYFSRNEFQLYTGVMKSMTGTQAALVMMDVRIRFQIFINVTPPIAPAQVRSL